MNNKESKAPIKKKKNPIIREVVGCTDETNTKIITQLLQIYLINVELHHTGREFLLEWISFWLRGIHAFFILLILSSTNSYKSQISPSHKV